MDPSKFAGKTWDVWANYVETQRKEPEEPIVKVESAVKKLPKEDMKMFGLCVDMEPLQLIVCEVCDMRVKPQALLHHYAIRHNGTVPKGVSSVKTSPKMVERKDTPVFASSSIELTSEKSIVISCENDSMSDVDVVYENVKDKTNLTSFPKMESKRLTRLETNRSPLGQMCTNRWHCKKKSSPAKNKLKVKNFALLKSGSSSPHKEKMETSSESSLQTNDEMNRLMQRLPEMSLNTVEEWQVSPISYSDSVPSISRVPRALSSAPWFSCHKAGGLYYPGRQMKRTYQSLQHLINIPTDTPQNLRGRRKNTSRQKKTKQ